MERSADRIRSGVTTPTARIMDKLQAGKTITAEERAHAISYLKRRIADSPETLQWRSLLVSLIQVRAKG